MIKSKKRFAMKNEILMRAVTPGGTFSRFIPLSFWHYRILPKWERYQEFDIFHDPDQIGCFFGNSNSRKVLTIHDLSPLMHPETHPLERVEKHRFILPKVLKRTDIIVVPSKTTADDVREILGIQREKVIPVYPGSDHLQSVAAPAKSKLLTNMGILRNDPFVILTVSTLEPRKNIEIIIEAFELICDNSESPNEIYLVIVGGRGWKSGGVVKRIRASPFRKNIIETGGVSDGILVGLYKNSSVFVCMSRKEGFGFPPLEAQYFGLPTVISRDRALLEVSGEGAMSVEKGKDKKETVQRLSRIIIKIRASEELQKSLSGKGRINASKYNTKKFTDGIVDIYENLMQHTNS